MSKYSQKPRASNFRRRVKFLQAVPVVVDGGGVSTASYTTLYTTWAEIIDLKTEDKLKYGLDGFSDAKEVNLRYSTGRDITTDLLVQYIDGNVTVDYKIISQQMITQDYKRFQQLVIQGFDTNATN